MTSINRTLLAHALTLSLLSLPEMERPLARVGRRSRQAERKLSRSDEDVGERVAKQQAKLARRARLAR
jgi:hypothetical protein